SERLPPHPTRLASSTIEDNAAAMRPVIGITAYAEDHVRWGAWDLPAALVPPSNEGLEETVGALDGLLLTGGSDLDPSLYGAEPHPETAGIRADRDSGELALLKAALERDLPVLAGCRGSQVLNVALGGDLVQHLPEVVGSDRHKETLGVFADHDVELRPGTRLEA